MFLHVTRRKEEKGSRKEESTPRFYQKEWPYMFEILWMSCGCLESVWKESGGCLDHVWRVSLGCPNDVWGVKMYLEGKPGLVRTSHVRTGQVKTGQGRHIKLGKFKSGQVKVVQFQSG